MNDDELDFERAEYGDDSASDPGEVGGDAGGDGAQHDADAAAADDSTGETDEASGPMTCTLCEKEISRSYFTKNDEFVCSACGEPANRAGPEGSAFTRFVGAVVAGTLAATVACALWMIVTKVTGYEIGLLAIAVGWIVGLAIMIGNRGVGGLPYRILAVFLTYSAIVLTYVPALAEEIQKAEFEDDPIALVDSQGELYAEPGLDETAGAAGGDAADESAGELDGERQPGGRAGATSAGATSDAANSDGDPADDDPEVSAEVSAIVAWIIAIPFAYAVPFLMGFENAIGLLIIGFALYQAWKMTAKPQIVWTGPFRIGHDADA